jgi:hypothetical protein
MLAVSPTRKRFLPVLLKPEILLFFTLAFTVAYFLLAHEGFFFNDDYGYARMAGEVCLGTFKFQDLPAYHRLAIFFPTVFFYRLFGVNIYAVTLWPLLCTLGSSVLIYLFFRKEDRQLTSWALVLFGLQFHTLFLSTYFFPDNILMFFALAAAGTLYVARRNNRNAAKYAVIFVLANFAALLSKETIIWYLPFYLWVAVADFFNKKNRVFWLVSLVFGAVVLFAYLLFYKLNFGSFLYRFTMVENTNLVMENNFITDSKTNLFPRLTYGPFIFLIGSGFFLPLAFCCRFFRNAGKEFSRRLENGESFWLILALLVLLAFWFGSTSVSFYNPITLIPRMATPFFAPLAIAASYQLRNFFRDGGGSLWFAVPLLAAALYLHNSMSVVYGLPGFYFLYLWYRNRSQPFSANPLPFLATLVLAMVLRPVYFMLKPSVSGFFEQEKVVKEFLKTAPENTILLTDGWFEKSAAYYYGFKEPHGVRILNYLDAETANAQENTFLLVNEKALTNPDWQFNPPQPRFNISEGEILARFPNRKLVAENGPVKLFRVFTAKE